MPEIKKFKNVILTSHNAFNTVEEVNKVHFNTYKNLEKDKWTQIKEWNDIDKTIELIKKTHEKYNKNSSLFENI